LRIPKFDLTVFSACLALLGFFGWHGFYGPRNLEHQQALVAEAKLLKTELEETAAARRALDQRVALMRPESVDPDMLDELARRYLNFAGPAELILNRK
jgi:cell division protein FtsB